MNFNLYNKPKIESLALLEADIRKFQNWQKKCLFFKKVPLKVDGPLKA